MRLECSTCVVRDWVPADKPDLVRHANNRNIWRNLTHMFPHPYTGADADEWFATLSAMPEPTHWAIEVDGHAVGGIGISIGDGVFSKKADFGYWLGEFYWNRGIMTDAVAAVAPYAMERFGLCRLEAAVFAWNPASMRVLERCGFVREASAGPGCSRTGRSSTRLITPWSTPGG
jgi:RimJ/RimL family protein N-acetyltransferase